MPPQEEPARRSTKGRAGVKTETYLVTPKKEPQRQPWFELNYRNTQWISWTARIERPQHAGP